METYLSLLLLLGWPLLCTSSSNPRSCSGRCGEGYYKGSFCQCDDECLGLNECCPDFQDLCTSKDSCKGRCGEPFNRGNPCHCDIDCGTYGQCCTDYEGMCLMEDFALKPRFKASAAQRIINFCLNLKNRKPTETSSEDMNNMEATGDEFSVPDYESDLTPPPPGDSALKNFPEEPEIVPETETPLLSSSSPSPDSSSIPSTAETPYESHTQQPSQEMIESSTPLPQEKASPTATEDPSVESPTSEVPTEDPSRDSPGIIEQPEDLSVESHPSTTPDALIKNPGSLSPAEDSSVDGSAGSPLPEDPSVKSTPSTLPTVDPSVESPGSISPGEDPLVEITGSALMPEHPTVESPRSTSPAAASSTEFPESFSPESSGSAQQPEDPSVVSSSSSAQKENPSTEGTTPNEAPLNSSPTEIASLVTKETQSTPLPAKPTRHLGQLDEDRGDQSEAKLPDPRGTVPFRPTERPPPVKNEELESAKDYMADDNDTDLCSGRPVSGLTTLRNGTTVVFRGHFFWTLDKHRNPDPPRLITAVWGIPSPIDTVYTRCNCQGKTYFFKGTNYWRFENGAMDPGFPKPISQGFGPIGHITAALSIPMYRSRKESVIFFKRGGMAQKYTYQVTPDCGQRPRIPVITVSLRARRQAAVALGQAINISKNWRGFPSMVTSAVSVPSRVKEGYKYYVFSQRKYYSIKMEREKPVILNPVAGPKENSENSFFKCNESKKI